MGKADILINPRLDRKSAEAAIKYLPVSGEYMDHYWIMTSGTTAKSANEKKWVALSRSAVYTSAQAVNQHLKSDSSDVWLHPLPDFHVGGLGIDKRVELSGASVVYLSKWNPVDFCEAANEKQATLSALVPAQVYDLLKIKAAPPSSLRGIIIGGGALAPALYERAISGGWPLLPSYGLSECASQAATAVVGSQTPDAVVLPHIHLKIDEEGYIAVQSKSLLSGYAFVTPNGIRLFDPKVEGWFTTEDKGSLENGFLTVYGRDQHFIKIGGESVNLAQLDLILQEVRMNNPTEADAALVVEKDERLGHIIQLIATDDQVDFMIESFNARVMPYERIRKKRIVDAIPRSSLGKVLRFFPC